MKCLKLVHQTSSGHPRRSCYEAIIRLIMMKNNFIAASANVNEMDDHAKKFFNCYKGLKKMQN